MKKVKLVVILALSLALLLALVLVMGGQAQGPGGDEKNEEGGVGGLGLADPPPAGYTVLYMFTGARDDYAELDPDTAATAVHCTNYGSSGVNVLVEISDYDNTPTISGTIWIPPSGSVTFCSQDAPVYAVDVVMWSTSDSINQGSGRVLADSSSAKIICTAQVIDPANDPPEYGAKLALYDGSGNLIGGESPEVYLPIIMRNYP